MSAQTREMIEFRRLISLVALALLLGLPGHAAAQANEDCFSCHSDKALTKKRGGK